MEKKITRLAFIKSFNFIKISCVLFFTKRKHLEHKNLLIPQNHVLARALKIKSIIVRSIIIYHHYKCNK